MTDPPCQVRRYAHPSHRDCPGVAAEYPATRVLSTAETVRLDRALLRARFGLDVAWRAYGDPAGEQTMLLTVHDDASAAFRRAADAARRRGPP